MFSLCQVADTWESLDGWLDAIRLVYTIFARGKTDVLAGIITGWSMMSSLYVRLAVSGQSGMYINMHSGSIQKPHHSWFYASPPLDCSDVNFHSLCRVMCLPIRIIGARHCFVPVTHIYTFKYVVWLAIDDGWEDESVLSSGSNVCMLCPVFWLSQIRTSVVLGSTS